MTEILALLAVIGMACIVWLAWGWMLLPGPCPIRAVVMADGGGEGLEQTVRGLLWLRKNRLWKGTVSIADNGLNQAGLTLALHLCRHEGVEFAGKLPGVHME